MSELYYSTYFFWHLTGSIHTDQLVSRSDLVNHDWEGTDTSISGRGPCLTSVFHQAKPSSPNNGYGHARSWLLLKWLRKWKRHLTILYTTTTKLPVGWGDNTSQQFSAANLSYHFLLRNYIQCMDVIPTWLQEKSPCPDPRARFLDRIWLYLGGTSHNLVATLENDFNIKNIPRVNSL